MNVPGCGTDEITTIAEIAFQVGGYIDYFYFILSLMYTMNLENIKF